MVNRVTVSELYAKPGFSDMIADYKKLAMKKLPEPKFLQEDYLPLEQAGILTVWCVMYGGLVVGFSSCLISKIPHYGVKVGIAESLFVRPSVRSAGFGLRLIAEVERHARDNGACAVLFSCPIASDFKKVLLHRNYSAETVTYVKSLICN